MYLHHFNHDPHCQLPTDRIRSILHRLDRQPWTHRIYLKIHIFWTRWTETVCIFFLIKVKRRDLKWWSSWTPRHNWIRAIIPAALVRAEWITAWPIHAISQSMVSPTNMHFRESGKYHKTEFRLRELVSGYSSREDSMDFMSL